MPPPPRKVIIERFAPLPNKPQPVIIERWLPYAPIKRKVYFNKSSDALVLKPKNIIVQWTEPEVKIKKTFKHLGLVKAEPNEYKQIYGQSLKNPDDLPNFVRDIKHPDGLPLAADLKHQYLYDLEGDLDALDLIDLNREGLGEYEQYLKIQRKNSIRKLSKTTSAIHLSSSISQQANLLDNNYF